MARQNAGTYGLRKQSTKNGVAMYWGLGIPTEIAAVIPEGTRFRPELTEEGILYRLVDPDEAKKIDVPSWAR